MKLSWWVYPVVALAIAAVALAYGFLGVYRPKMAEAKQWKEYGDALQIEVNKTPAAEKRRDAAVAEVKRIGAEWQDVVLRKTPPGSLAEGGISLMVNRWQLTVDSQRFRESVQRAVNRQVKAGGVRVVSGPAVPQPSSSGSTILSEYYNYPAIKFPVCIFELGTVTVQGTWSQIRDNVRSWQNMPNYLATTDGLTVTGTSPNLTATYSVVVVAYIRNGISGLVPEFASSGGPGGAPGLGVPGGGPTPGTGTPGAPGGAGAQGGRPSLSAQGG